MRLVQPDFGLEQVRVTFGAQSGYRWQLQFLDHLGGGVTWEALGDPVLGEDAFVEMIYEGTLGTGRIYRVAGTPLFP